MTLRIAVIADKGAVQRFALDALDEISGTNEITVFSCTNTRIRKHWARNAAYYALNLATVRNRLTRYVPVRSGKKHVVRQVEFASGYDGAWQVLPPATVENLRDFDVVLKFGMGLLRIPSAEALPTPILSYHHGDPDRYRGRPAGFWEIDDGAPIIGQVVQILGNRLDAGKVVAFAETKVFPWSYRRTLVEAYRHSPLLINRGIRNAISRTYVDKPSDGRNCRLPSNLQVIGFLASGTRHFLGRVLYGGFQDKAWETSTATIPRTSIESLLKHGEFPPAESWHTIQCKAEYGFYADPFFANDPPSIVVEAYRTSSGLGEIVRIDEDGQHLLIREPGHMSYPATFTIGGREIIVPEVAGWSEPLVYENGKLVGSIKMRDAAQVLDPTLIEKAGRIYLFGNDRRLGTNVLQLWSAESLDGEFRLHPSCPIRVSAAGARMGGNILKVEDRLFRFGQDFSREYGDGLVVFEIDRLSPEDYAEHEVGRIRFGDRKGPHTLNFRGDEIVFDWYRDRFSPFAGVSRVLSALQRRNPQATQ